MNLPVILPLLIPLLLVILHLGIAIGREARLGHLHHGINMGGSLLFLGLSSWLWLFVLEGGTAVTRGGGWPAPMGILLVADLLSASMIWITSFIGAMIAVYLRFEDCRTGNRTRPGYFIAFQALLLGVTGSFLASDLFNLYVWFEVMLMGSFVLIAFEGKTSQLEGALKYTALNLLTSILFLGGIALIYSSAGTLNFADLATKLGGAEATPATQTGFALLLIAFGTKAGVFPLNFWLPPSYPTPRIATSALLAGLLTKVGVYTLIRSYTLIFSETLVFSGSLLVGISLLTMVTGVLGAASQFEIRRILSFHIISQIGYMTLGLAFFTPAALAAAVFYILHHIVVKTNLFLISGVIEQLKGTSDLKRIGGLSRSHPALAILFLIPALSLAGVPPLSGFFAKFSLIRAAALTESWVSIGVALLVGLLTLFSMMKIWLEAFWKPQPASFPASTRAPETRAPFGMMVPIAIMAAITLAFGIYPPLLLQPAERIAGEILDPENYVRAVLGKPPRGLR